MEKYLDYDDVMNLIIGLSQSQGFYGRLYRYIKSLDKRDLETFKKEIKRKKFTRELDVIYWLECEE